MKNKNREFGTPATLRARRNNIITGRADLHTLVSQGGLDHTEIIQWASERGMRIDPFRDPGQQLDDAHSFLNREGIA